MSASVATATSSTKKLSRKQLIVLYLLGSLIFLSAVGTTVWLVSTRDERQTTTAAVESAQEIEGELIIPDALPDDLDSLSVLLLGYGGRGHQGGYLTDVMQVVHIDFAQKQVSLISLPRDVFVKLPNGKHAKVNAAFTLGDDVKKPVESGGVVAKRMVEQILGLPIDHFIAVDFDGFQRTIGGWLGGIEVEVSETLDDPWYPIRGLELEPCGKTPEEIAELTVRLSGFELERQFPCRYERVLFTPGKHAMQGGDALKYVRSRHGSAGGDFSRSRRQHEVLSAIRSKVFSMQALEKAPEYFAKAQQEVVTDISLADVEKLTPLLKTGVSFSQKTVVLSTDNVLTTAKSSSGQFILQPKAGQDNWREVHQFVMREIK
jgi:LCP family protein required for cell wall assembly